VVGDLIFFRGRWWGLGKLELPAFRDGQTLAVVWNGAAKGGTGVRIPMDYIPG